MGVQVPPPVPDVLICPQCKKSFERLFSNGKEEREYFCSHSCKAKTLNRKRTENTEKVCPICKIVFKKRYNTFCSRECAAQSRSLKLKEVWLKTGNHSCKQSVQIGTPVRIRKYVKHRVNDQCERCGWNEINPFSGKVSLEIHHIDGNPFNDNIHNLQVLCPNCHSLTKNFKSLNKGSGRKKRAGVV